MAGPCCLNISTSSPDNLDLNEGTVCPKQVTDKIKIDVTQLDACA